MGKLSKEQKFALISAVAVGVGSLIALLTYLKSRKHRELQTKNAELENEIKKLQLMKLKTDAKK
jgi:flagellar biosynthesis/type III secretory pathway M-ring protein FliF/YscJ